MALNNRPSKRPLGSSLREQVGRALMPCEWCERTEPHAYEDPDGHSWDPHHMVVAPRTVAALLDVRDVAGTMLRLIETEAMSFEDESLRSSFATMTTLRIALSAAADL